MADSITIQPPAMPSKPPSEAIPSFRAATKEELADTSPKMVKQVDGPTETHFQDEEPNLTRNLRKSMEARLEKQAQGEEKPAEVRETVTKAPAEKTEASTKKEKAAEKTVTPAKPELPEKVDESDPPEEERRILPTDSPRVSRRLKYFHRQMESAQKERDAAKAELDAAKKTTANPEELTKLREEYQKTQDELVRFRRLYDINQDTEFKSKYDEPVAQAETSIEGIFKKYGMADETLKAVKGAGGFGAFSASNQTFPVRETDPENPQETKIVQRTAAQLSRAWLDSLPVQDAEFIKAALGKQRLLSEEKKVAAEKAIGDAKNYYEQQRQAAQQQSEQAKKSTEEVTAKYAAMRDKAIAERDWMKEVAIPDNANEQDRENLTVRNSLIKELRESMDKHPSTPEEYLDLKINAAHAKILERSLQDKDGEIARLQEELKRIKSSTRTTTKGGSLLVTGGQKPTEETQKGDPTDFSGALRRSLQKRMNRVDE